MDVPWRPSIQSMIEAIATIFFPRSRTLCFEHTPRHRRSSRDSASSMSRIGRVDLFAAFVRSLMHSGRCLSGRDFCVTASRGGVAPGRETFPHCQSRIFLPKNDCRGGTGVQWCNLVPSVRRVRSDRGGSVRPRPRLGDIGS